nr:MAG TPA: hypothetical protein [Caudoviricetes sp.]
MAVSLTDTRSKGCGFNPRPLPVRHRWPLPFH